MKWCRQFRKEARHIVEMIIFIGIQAVGKSEFYKQYFYDTHIRINLDMLKTRHREKLLIEACIAAKQPFVVDNTNPTEADRGKYISLAKASGFRVVGYYFQSSIDDAVACNEQRVRIKPVPKAAILTTHKKLEMPNLCEGFDALHYVRKNGSGGFIVEEYSSELFATRKAASRPHLSLRFNNEV